MKSFDETLAIFADEESRKALRTMQRGIEREALRINADNELALTPHPASLGAALTHSRITTDYSESLMEFITPVYTDVDQMLKGLTETHAYAVQHLNGEKLWPVSMPCYVGDEKQIPISYYGTSNSGILKRLYRKGLTYRYGALMQIIAGVHFNFSVSDALWQTLYQHSDKQLSLGDFISDRYFDLIRNYRRLVWVLPYLFGASPAICRSFIKDQQTELDFLTHSSGTLYRPYSTSLRMSDLGYTNKEQEKLSISYNSLQEYLQGIKAAIKMPSKKFADIGVNVDGEYRQLNANILQIENEFYAPIRAKRVTKRGEKPSEALCRAGVQYIEVRALDVNPFSPIGIDASQVRFLDLFLLYCLMQPSAKVDAAGEKEIAANLKAVVLEGRKLGLILSRNGEAISLQQWMRELFADLGRIAAVIDGDDRVYADTLAHWSEAVENPEMTLSGRIWQSLAQTGLDHGAWVRQLAEQYHRQLVDYPIPQAALASLDAEAAASIEQQHQLEASDKLDFEQFLAEYFRANTQVDEPVH
ncbi:glutamate--cysteine ligase [Shewanella avicenniae]|uniref:Glutamate--cysteine ligase n=1 Tax=Shewanella avicenniae TaxID=2814294 RepID=A0ABX7QTI0_9GAMM|nr:glutamate--cysteine ligase [Shewanella avicenniae]QSX34782.1 glutamate--cysteine ligase [Shewanella avicenniae]